VSEGSRLANLEAKAASKKYLTSKATEVSLVWDSSLKETKPQYTPAEKEWLSFEDIPPPPSFWMATH
jgi:hypothetical protein